MSRRRKQNEQAALDRLPPHAPEAEAGVLGCILLSPQESLSDCARTFKDARCFYDLAHQKIYDALAGMYDGHEHIDSITLQRRLADAGELEQVGGLDYLVRLPDAVPSAANLPAYLEIVFEKYLLRRMLQTLTAAAGRLMECDEPVPPLLDKIEAEVLAVNESGTGPELRSMARLVQDVGELVENIQRGVGLISGVRTHFGYFDKMTGGLHRKELTVLAARPSVGKTSLMMNIACNVAQRQKLPVGIFSMEMSADDLTLRVMCAEAAVDFHKVRTGFPSREDVQGLAEISKRVMRMPLHIDDTPALGILELRARARRLVQRNGVGLFCVDYLQLMHGSRDYNGNRAMEVAEISGGLKSLAKEMNVAVLVLSQLNREVERQKNRKPQLADLRESGSIEQDADLVGLLYRPKTDHEEEEEPPVIPVNMLIAKQRNGPTGDVEFVFRKALMQFEDAYANRGRLPLSREQGADSGEQSPFNDRGMPTNLELGISAAQPNNQNIKQ